MEFSDEYLCAFDMPDINAKDLLRSLWMPTTGVDSAFVESDPPIAEFVELDYKDLFCCPLPPSPGQWSHQIECDLIHLVDTH